MNPCPITLSTGWTPAQDVKSYRDRFCYPDEEIQDYIPNALENVSASVEELNATVDAALRYFVRKDANLVRVHPGTLTVREKLHHLGGITSRCNGDYQYKLRFAKHVHDCL